MPPCGGTPYRNARSRWPNCSSVCSGVRPRPRRRVAARRDGGSGCSRPELEPVQREVVGTRLRGLGREVLGQRRGERVVVRDPLALLLRPVEQRRLRVPAEPPLPSGIRPSRSARCRRNPSSATFVRSGLSATIRIRSPGPAPVARRTPSISPGDRCFSTGERIPALDRDPDQAGRPARLRHLHQFVELLAGQCGAARCRERLDESARVQDRRERPEARPRERLADVCELHPVPQVGLVRTVPVHHLVVGQPRERHGDLDALDLAHDARVQGLDHREDVLLVDERHLHVELCELEAAVGARRLVAQASDDLVVAILSGHHQQLLELLRRLRQRVERPGPQPRRDQEVSGTLGRAPAEQQGLDLQEPRDSISSRTMRLIACRIARTWSSRDVAGRGSGSGAGAPPRPRSGPRSRTGVSASASTSSSATATSISPVGSSGFTVPRGRCRTSPETRITDSEPRCCAAARASARPRDGRRAAPGPRDPGDRRRSPRRGPAGATPTRRGQRARRRARPGLAARVRPHRRPEIAHRIARALIALQPNPFREPVHHIADQDLLCSPSARLFRMAVSAATSRSPRITAYAAPERSASLSCAFKDRSSNIEAAGMPAFRNSSTSRSATCVASVRSRPRSTRARPDRGPPLPPRVGEEQPVQAEREARPASRVRQAPRRARRTVRRRTGSPAPARARPRRTRTSCVCSSRALGRAGIVHERDPAASSPLRTAAKCSAQAWHRLSEISGAPSTSGVCPSTLQSNTRSGLVRSRVRQSSSSSAWCGSRYAISFSR